MTDIQELLDDARSIDERPHTFESLRTQITVLANALEIEAMDRVHAEKALRHYGIPEDTTPNNGDALSEHYDDTLQVTANIDTVGVITLTLPIRLADESGAPDIVRAFDLARDIVDAAAGLAAEDEATDGHLADVYEFPFPAS